MDVGAKTKSALVDKSREINKVQPGSKKTTTADGSSSSSEDIDSDESSSSSQDSSSQEEEEYQEEVPKPDKKGRIPVSQKS